MSRWKALADQVLAGSPVSRDQALSVLEALDEDTPEIVAEAYRLRRRYFGHRVKLNFLLNIKSGLCPEDCHYCSQAKDSTAPIDKYPFLSVEDIQAAIDRAVSVKAKRVCLVASGRGPAPHEVEKVASIVRGIKNSHPEMEVCCCLGLLAEGQGAQLKEAGAYAYNHNLNTSERRYGEICETHTYQDREATVERAKQSGLSACSGALFGMGESDEDRVDVALALRKAGSESVPINFLIPIEGTPLHKKQELTPWKCLRIISMVRFIHPDVEVRIAGGRELHLRSLQSLGLLVANSIFIGDYLTTSGQAPQQDLDMIRDLGFSIEGEEPSGEVNLASMVKFISQRRES